MSNIILCCDNQCMTFKIFLTACYPGCTMIHVYVMLCIHLQCLSFILAGMFTKSKINRYKQVIEVKNTHKHTIRIQVEDQLPRSEDQKIKVLFIFN